MNLRRDNPGPQEGKAARMIRRTPVRLVLAGLISLGPVGGCESPPPPPPETQPAETRYDDAYLAALSVVDDFCHAWKNRDLQAGRALLSRRTIRRHPDARIRDAIVGAENPKHAAFEIIEGKKLSDGRYVFDVRLFFRYAGLQSDRIESPIEKIVIARDESGRWRVSELPIPRIPGRLLRTGPPDRTQ